MIERLGRIGYCYVSADGRTVQLSDEAARIHGHSGEARTASLDAVLPTFAEADRARVRDALQDALARGRAFPVGMHT